MIRAGGLQAASSGLGRFRYTWGRIITHDPQHNNTISSFTWVHFAPPPTADTSANTTPYARKSAKFWGKFGLGLSRSAVARRLRLRRLHAGTVYRPGTCVIDFALRGTCMRRRNMALRRPRRLSVWSSTSRSWRHPATIGANGVVVRPGVVGPVIGIMPAAPLGLSPRLTRTRRYVSCRRLGRSVSASSKTGWWDGGARAWS